MIDRVGRNLSIIVKAERKMLWRRVTVMRQQTVIGVVAAIFGTIGLVMLNIAGFYAMTTWFGTALAALFVSVGNLVIAIALFVWAAGFTARREIEGLMEVRDMAYSDLEAEMDATVTEIDDLQKTVRDLVREPLSVLGVGAMGTLVGFLVRLFRR
ncbi:hypothetical protein [Tropicimonas sp.]|uniref:hypothetical protein n=1 Tax=Tropicimonas sp. TaxID=2067044 RepID=UPI003A83AFE1